MKKFVMFQQNYMMVLEMANNLSVSVLLVLCVFIAIEAKHWYADMLN